MTAKEFIKQYRDLFDKWEIREIIYLSTRHLDGDQREGLLNAMIQSTNSDLKEERQAVLAQIVKNIMPIWSGIGIDPEGETFIDLWHRALDYLKIDYPDDLVIGFTPNEVAYYLLMNWHVYGHNFIILWNYTELENSLVSIL